MFVPVILAFTTRMVRPVFRNSAKNSFSATAWWNAVNDSCRSYTVTMRRMSCTGTSAKRQTIRKTTATNPDCHEGALTHLEHNVDDDDAQSRHNEQHLREEVLQGKAEAHVTVVRHQLPAALEHTVVLDQRGQGLPNTHTQRTTRVTSHTVSTHAKNYRTMVSHGIVFHTSNYPYTFFTLPSTQPAVFPSILSPFPSLAQRNSNAVPAHSNSRRSSCAQTTDWAPAVCTGR